MATTHLRPRALSRRTGLTLLALLGSAGCGSGMSAMPEDVVVRERDGSIPARDAAADGEAPCYPDFVPGAWRYTRTWQGSHVVAMAFDVDGSLVVALRFTGTIDLDPGPGVQSFSSMPGADRYAVVRLRADGAYDWGHALDPQLQLSAVAVTRDRRVVYAGAIAVASIEAIDFDPGPGVASQPVVGLGRGVFVTALHADGTFEWVRQTTARPVAGAVTGLAPRTDGGLLVVGAAAGDGTVGIPSTRPDAVPNNGLPFLWQLRGDGSTALLAPLPMAATQLTVAADDSVLMRGLGYGSWDADFTYGRDDQETNAVFTVLPASWITMLGPDLSYRWTESTWDAVTIGTAVFDDDHHVYATGTIGNQHVMVNTWDIDSGPEQHMRLNGSFVVSWDAQGRYRWADPPRTMYGSMLADTRGVYTYEPVAVLSDTGRSTQPQIVALDGAGRWRWSLRLGGTGVARPEAMARGAGARRAIGGTFTESIDHAFGGAAPDPHTAQNTELPGDGFVTVFDDEGGAAARCEEQALEALPAVICNPAFPTRCGDLQAECGSIADPCAAGRTLDCGACTEPEACGGGGVPNRCGRPAPRVIADGLEHPLHVRVDATHVYFTTQGDYGPLETTLVGDAGVPSPVRESLRLWRAPREGGVAPELLFETRARPTELFVGSSSVYLRYENYEARTRGLVRIPKAAPSMPQLLDPDAFGMFYTEDRGRLLFAGGAGVMTTTPDASTAPLTLIRGCFPTRLIFEGAEVFFDCRDAADTRSFTLRSTSASGGSDTLRTVPTEALRLEYVSSTEIYFTAYNGIWYRLPRNGTAATPPERVGLPPDPATTDVLGERLHFDGTYQYYLWTGPGSDDTDRGVLRAIPLSDTLRQRVARGLNHPRSFAMDGNAIWIAEEGSLGMTAHTGRILRVDR